MKFGMGTSLAVILVLQTGCASETVHYQPAEAITADQGLEPGYWLSDGYGYLLDTTREDVRFYHVAGASCVGVSAPGLTLTDLYDWRKVLEEGTRVSVWTDVEPHRVVYDRLEALPVGCVMEGEVQDFEANFQAFVDYFSKHYTFFDLYDVDWESRVENGRQSLARVETEAQLFALFIEMVDGIEDAHLDLDATIDGERFRHTPGEGRTPLYIERHAGVIGTAADDAASFFNGYWSGTIRDEILNGEGGASANRRIQYGMASESVGYIAMLSVGLYASGDDIGAEDNLAAFTAEMDQALASLKSNGAEALILDLSVNFGGYDYISRAAARYFTTRPVEIYSKLALDADRLESRTPYALSPTELSFGGPVYVLTSDATVSGGETLTLALRAIETVHHYGEPTRGALSNKLEKTLPNGWSVSLSNEAYYDHEGALWEGRGVPPTCPLPVFESENPLASHRAAVSQLVEHANAGEACSLATAH